MALELTFVNQYGDSIPKRRRLTKACASCRARKKRCAHVAGNLKQNGRAAHSDSVDGSPGSAKLSNETHSADRTETRLSDDSDSSHARNDIGAAGSRRPLHKRAAASTGSTRRFVSDLNPEATLLQSFTPLAENPRAQQPNENIGIWVDRREWEALVRQKHNAGAAGDNSGHRPLSRNGARLDARPHHAVVAPLLDIYFRKVHPLLPLLDETEFRQNYAAGLNPEALVYAVCLVAAKDREAEPYLRLDDTGNDGGIVLAPREFSSRLHATVLEGISKTSAYDKITLVRILTLASLHSDGQDGGEEASLLLIQAMHYTQMLGWHLGQHTGVASSDGLATKRLFWCLYGLDRISSSMYSRPIMISDADKAIESFKPGESGFPAFETFLYLCQLLNKVIGFYRPTQPLTVTGWEEDFPSFEDALEAQNAWHLPKELLATLHLFYLQIAVLSHRSRGVKYTIRSTASYVRQSLCAIELIRLMTSDLFPSLHPMPFLPYAVSLAMSVAYQRLRQSQLNHQQEDARNDFRTCYLILQGMRRTWASADIITTIAKKVLDEVDKAKDLSSFRVDRTTIGQASPAICTASLSNPETLIDRRTLNQHSGGTTLPNEVANGTATPKHDGFGLFEGIDDVFGTYLDPNYPINLDDFSFIDSMEPLNWHSVPSSMG